MTTPLLLAAFAMGFFGSPHCLGMCGGLVTAFGLSMQEVSPLKKRGLIATYHFGRLVSYSILGVIAGIVGTTVLAPLLMGNSTPRILLGLVLVFIGLSMLGMPFLNKLEKVGMGVWKKLSPLRQKVFPITTFPRALAAGLLWGFLPCGLVYGALLMAVVGNDIATGALLMFVFGLGTVPMLVATQETVGWLHKQIGRYKLRQLNGVVMILSGLAVIALPMAMKYMGGHGSHGGHQVHGSSISAPAEHGTHNMQHMADENMGGHELQHQPMNDHMHSAEEMPMQHHSNN
ncbi:MAG TPA: sulfite exporter TauE/SafE family protein [Psychrobacter pasteurii]|nr:sulfite exporter TauE/SafE family protein [Psychrobacter pasteurii]